MLKTVSSATFAPLRPKILLYGREGTGKTVTALSLPGRKLVLDGEKGTLPYVGQWDWDVPAAEDGSPQTSDDIGELERLLDALSRQPSDHTVLVVDPITVYHHGLQELADATLRRSKQRLSDYESAMHPGAWGRLNVIWRRIWRKVRRLDMAVIVTAREQERLEQKGDSLVSGGVLPAGPKDSVHEFDAVFRLRRAGTRVVAEVAKIRGRDCEPTINPFSAADLVQIYGEEAFTRPARPVTTLAPEQEAEIRALLKLAQISDAALQTALSRRGVGMIEELTEAQAEEMLKNLRGMVQDQAAPSDNDNPKGKTQDGTRRTQAT